LRVLQEGEVRPVGAVKTQKVDIRLIAATHRDLNQRCRDGLFREDLFFRLNVFQLQIPALRERGEDIIALADAIIERYCENYNKPALSLSLAATEAVKAYPWPGNVRELENAVQRAVILCEDQREIPKNLLALNIELNELHQETKPSAQDSSQNSEKHTEADLSLEDYFQQFVLDNEDSMSETELAKKLGVSRKCLWERRQKLGIPRKKRV